MKIIIKTISMIGIFAISLQGRAQTESEIKRWSMEQCLTFIDKTIKDTEGKWVTYEDGSKVQVSKLDRSLGLDKNLGLGILKKDGSVLGYQLKSKDSNEPSFGEVYEDIDWTNYNFVYSGSNADEDIEWDSEVDLYKLKFYDTHIEESSRKESKRTGYVSDGFGNDWYKYGGVDTKEKAGMILFPYLNNEDENGMETGDKIQHVLKQMNRLLNKNYIW